LRRSATYGRRTVPTLNNNLPLYFSYHIKKIIGLQCPGRNFRKKEDRNRGPPVIGNAPLALISQQIHP
jgi:hypothetical protein